MKEVNNMNNKYKYPVQVTQVNQSEKRFNNVMKKIKGKAGKIPRPTKHNRKG
jgi:hypothetical protein